MSIQNNFPAIRPSLNLDFANTKELDPRIIFARASTASYYGTQTAKAEENLFLQSQDITNGVWGITGSARASNTTTAPNGTTTAGSITASASTIQHGLSQNTGSIIGTQRVFSFFVKANTHNFVQLLFGTDTQAFANFNVTAGAGAVGTVGSTAAASIVDAGNGWYRCNITTSSVTASATVFILIVSSSTAARFETWTTVGTESVYLWGAQLEQRSSVTSYTPTTTQPITNYIPVLETAASGVARFDHNPTTFESLGFLVEEQRTNLLTYSEDFADAGWAKSGTTITANTIVAPDGTLTGDKLVENTSSGIQHRIGQSIATTTNQTYTFTFYAKAGETPEFVAQIVASGSSATTSSIGFAITAGVISPSGIAGIVSSSSAQAVGNGWYRCSVVYTLNGTVTDHQVRIFPRSTISYTGDGYSGLYIWGAQLEAGAFPTSYIPTVASQVTRAADAASMTGVNFSSWYREDEGTLYADAITLAPLSSTRAVASINDNTANNRWTSAVIDSGGPKASTLRNTSGAGLQASPTSAGAANTTQAGNKVAVALTNYEVSICLNGGAVATATNTYLAPVVTQMQIGQQLTSAFINGYIRKLAFYPNRLSNTELQGLTS